MHGKSIKARLRGFRKQYKKILRPDTTFDKKEIKLLKHAVSTLVKVVKRPFFNNKDKREGEILDNICIRIDSLIERQYKFIRRGKDESKKVIVKLAEKMK